MKGGFEHGKDGSSHVHGHVVLDWCGEYVGYISMAGLCEDHVEDDLENMLSFLVVCDEDPHRKATLRQLTYELQALGTRCRSKFVSSPGGMRRQSCPLVLTCVLEWEPWRSKRWSSDVCRRLKLFVLGRPKTKLIAAAGLDNTLSRLYRHRGSFSPLRI